MSDGARARLLQLCAQYGLDEGQRSQLATLLEVLAGDQRAATTVRDPVVAVDRHVADSLTALGLSDVRAARRMVDVGTGAGFPALVLAVALPRCEVVALDPVRRKADWVGRTAGTLGLANLLAVHARAEDWASGRERHDVVTVRAVGPLAVLVEYAAPLLRVGGALVAWKGTIGDDEWRAGRTAADRLAMEPPGATPTAPYPGSRDHRLVTVIKRGPTPPRYPRRTGMARKHPLG